MYCEGLQYFVPLITAEEDANKRQQLQQRAMSYMERAEEIKRSAKQAYFLQRQISASASKESNPGTSQSTKCTSENATIAVIYPKSSFKQLCQCIKYNIVHLNHLIDLVPIADTLFASTPSVQNALDIARQAELYSYEQNFPLALESFTTALKVLVPLLKQEPNGNRKELLQQQVMDWLREAESIKGLISAHNLTENKTLHQHCVIQ